MPIILLIIGVILVIYNYRGIKKEEGTKGKNEVVDTSFKSVLKENHDEFNEYKMELGILRRDIAESLTELQEEILDIKNNLNKLKSSRKVYENKEELENHENNDLVVDLNIDESVISEINFIKEEDSSKTQNIKKLLKEGLTAEEICYELSVSKGEVLLVQGLYKK